MAEKEYIEREAAISGLDELEKTSHHNSVLWPDHVEECREVLRFIPAADVRPVVLCRDCKWTKTDGMEDPAIYCMKWDRWEMPQDGFCWLGRKRGDRR